MLRVASAIQGRFPAKPPRIFRISGNSLRLDIRSAQIEGPSSIRDDKPAREQIEGAKLYGMGCCF